MKAATLVLTTLIMFGLGAAWFLMLIVVLNGFTEEQAQPGLILFIVWAILTAIVAGVLGFWCAGYLTEKRSFSPALAALASVVFSVIGGAASDFIGFIVAVAITTARR
ncbi:MAG TPA: hypothetical protein VK308_02095 [Pyrinomonadaceae bacterium]|nr:hypothetical protein [Pyrinomonadaceae bacterium]